MNYFVSLEMGIWVERKKGPLFKKIYISKKQAELNELRIFASFSELTCYFLLFIYFISFLFMTFSGTHLRTVCTGSYMPLPGLTNFFQRGRIIYTIKIVTQQKKPSPWLIFGK